MAVDLSSLSMPDFLELLRYEGHPPPDPEFDNIRMTPQEWAELFPGAAQPDDEDEEAPVDVTADPAPAPAPA